MRGFLARLAVVGIVLVGVGCDLLGASEITVSARNESAQEMVIQVVAGVAAGAPDYGPQHTVDPGDEREVELAVPGGDWTVTVNGEFLLGSTDADGRRGRLPVTLVLPDPEIVPVGPFWEAPGDWAHTGP